MARTPYQVLVIPYRIKNDSIEYCILKRSDSNQWQWISGGVEDGESILESAQRESLEEAQLPTDSKYVRLESITSIPIKYFKELISNYSGKLVIPEYSFAVEVKQEIVLSEEHLECKWVSYDTATKYLEFDSNKTALWELDQRISK